MSPEVKWYTNIYVILTYTARETHVLFGLFIPEIHFFGRGLKFLWPPKGLMIFCLLLNSHVNRKLLQNWSEYIKVYMSSNQN